MTIADIRIKSLEEAKRLRCPVNVNLPLLDTPTSVRSTDEAGRRLLTPYAAASVAYGFESVSARNWLAREGLDNQLTEPEAVTLSNGASVPNGMRRNGKSKLYGLWLGP
jgi:hypothetical protein